MAKGKGPAKLDGNTSSGKKGGSRRNPAKTARLQANTERHKSLRASKLEARREVAREHNEAKRKAGKRLGGTGRHDAKKRPDAVLGGLNNPYPKV